MEKKFGTLLLFDCKDCYGRISDRNELEEFLNVIIQEMDMKMIGEPVFEYFENTDFNVERGLVGYSITCIISLSSITIHVCDIQKTAYIDIFTCCKIDDDKVDIITNIVKDYFESREVRVKILDRGLGWD